MYCLSGSNGDLIWKKRIRTFYEPTLADDKIIIADKCFSLDGELLWDVGGIGTMSNGESTSVYDGKTYQNCGSKLVCRKLDDGEVIWQRKNDKDYDYNTMYRFSASPVSGFGRVFIADHDNIYCYDHQNGGKIWTAPFGTSVKVENKHLTRDFDQGGIAVSDSVVVLSGGNGTACMDIDSGEILWESDVKGCLPVIVGDKYVWTAKGGTLSCLSLTDGKVIVQRKYDVGKKGKKHIRRLLLQKIEFL